MATSKLRLRPDKKGRDNELSVYIQVCINSKVKLYPTGIKTKSSFWDSKNQKIKKEIGSNEHIRNNIILEKRHQEIRDIIFEKTLRNDALSFEYIDKALRPKETTSLLFSHWFGKFVEEQRRKFKQSTLKSYFVFKNQVLEFQCGKDFELAEINFEFYTDFRNWLIDSKNHNNSTVNKRLKTLKTFLRFCSEFDIYEISTLSKFRMLEEHGSTKIALSQQELDLLLNYDFTKNKRLDKVRDLFIFACVTGLRISDIGNLTKANVRNGFIYLNVIKTSQNSGIPLNNIASKILTKYACSLPKISGQKINDYLKEIGEKVGINAEEQVVNFRAGKRIETFVPRYELLSSHVGRRTFITLSILKGIPTPVIQSITGHKDLKSFQKYIQLNNKDKMEAMKLWN